MKNILNQLKLFHSATNLDIYLYDENLVLHQQFTSPLSPNFPSNLIKDPLSSIKIKSLKNGHIIGYFQLKKSVIALQTSNHTIQGKGIYVARAPLLELNQFKDCLALLFNLLTHSNPRFVNSSKMFSDDILKTSSESDHNFYQGYLAEQDMLLAVEKGNLKEYKHSFLKFIKLGNFGTLASSNTRSAKNLAIAATTLYTRAAIRGGISAEDAYDLSNQIINQIEDQVNFPNIYEETRAIGELFLNRVNKEHQKNIPPLVRQAEEYIVNNLSKIKNITEVSQYLNISTSYLARIFKHYTGITLKLFIRNTKITYAKKKLLFSDNSITEIAESLGFNSISDFSRTFKRTLGETPSEFRKNHLS